MGNGLVAGARGLRVRVHREGGGLVGSALLRRTETSPREPDRALPPVSNPLAATVETGRLAAMEALLAKVLARSAAQDREITALRGTIAEMGPVREGMGNLHARLDELEAVAHRHDQEEDAEEVDDEHEDEENGEYDEDE